MTGELEPLDSDLAALLDAERARPAGSPEAMERVFTRVEASIGALPSGGGDQGPGAEGGGGGATGSPIVDGASAASSAGAAGAGLSATGAGIAGAKLALFTGAIFALGLGAGAGLHATLTKEPAPRVEVVEKIVKIPVVMRPDPGAPKPDPEEPAVAPLEPNEALVPSGSTTTPKTTGTLSTIDPATSSAGRERDRQLSEENLLIARAQAALARQDVRGALDALHLHAARFPQGQMRPERELMLREAQRLDKATP